MSNNTTPTPEERAQWLYERGCVREEPIADQPLLTGSPRRGVAQQIREAENAAYERGKADGAAEERLRYDELWTILAKWRARTQRSDSE